MAESAMLTSRRLSLEPFSERHLTDRYVAWLNDKDVVRYSEQRHRRHSLETCRLYADNFRNSPHYFWAIVASDSALGHIGNMTATVNVHNLVADLAIIIGEPNARGHGYGREAWQRACRFLLNEAGMRKVTAGTMAENQPMLRIMDSTGMIVEGRRKEQFLLDGRPVDMIMATLFRT